jgi:hypothetical protein
LAASSIAATTRLLVARDGTAFFDKHATVQQALDQVNLVAQWVMPPNFLFQGGRRATAVQADKGIGPEITLFLD